MHPAPRLSCVSATALLALAPAILLAPALAAQPVDVVKPAAAANLRATDGLPAHGDAAPLPLASFSAQRGIGIVADDGNSYWPGYPSDLHAPATLRIVPAANNTFTIRRA